MIKTLKSRIIQNLQASLGKEPELSLANVARVPNGYPFIRHFVLGDIEFDFWILDPDVAEWYQDGWREAGELHELTRLVKKGDRVLEIGSHQGFTGMLLRHLVGEAGFVLGIEAHPLNVMMANAQMGLNGIATNLCYINAAGTDVATEVTIRQYHNSAVSLKPEEEGVIVRGISGNQLDQEYGPFTFLKVDVEGFEENVLKGCSQILARKPTLAIEVHMGQLAQYGSSLQRILAILSIQTYEGTMIIRPNYNRVLPFDPMQIPETGIVNLFLQPRL